MTGAVCCGGAKRCITPPDAMLRDLRGLQDVRFSGVLDDIFVRVLAVSIGGKTALVAAFELDKVPCPREFLAAVTEATGVPEEYITLLATHIHTAPIAGYRPNEGPNFIERKPLPVQEATHAYERFLERRLLEAAREAVERLEPARLRWGSGESYVNINRVQDYMVRQSDGTVRRRCGLGQSPAAPADRRLFVLAAETLSGRPIAFLVNYAVHNCVMIRNRCGRDGGTLMCSDLGGQVSKYLEADYPGSVALWTSGAAGDVNPVMSNEIYYPDPETGAQLQYELPPGDTAPIMMLQTLAARHYEDIKAVLRKTEYKEAPDSLFGAVRWTETPGRRRGEGGDWETGAHVPPYQIRIHLLRIGMLCMVGFSGELFTSQGLALRGVLPEDAVVFNHESSLLAESGYIFDDAVWERDAGEALPGRRSSLMQPGYVLDAILQAVTEMYRSGRP